MIWSLFRELDESGLVKPEGAVILALEREGRPPAGGARMLVIGGKQMAALQRDSDERWYDGRLTELYPSFAEAPPVTRMQWIREGVERAAGFGLARPDHFQFLCFEQTYAPGCVHDPAFEWARLILADAGDASAASISTVLKRNKFMKPPNAFLANLSS